MVYYIPHILFNRDPYKTRGPFFIAQLQSLSYPKNSGSSRIKTNGSPPETRPFVPKREGSSSNPFPGESCWFQGVPKTGIVLNLKRYFTENLTWKLNMSLVGG